MIAILGFHGFAYRIARLLHTCIPPTILSYNPRIKRATICLQAINAICDAKKLEMNESVQLVRRLEDGQSSAALLGFKRLDPRDKALSSEVVTTATLIAKKIEAAAHNGVQDIPLSVVMAVSQISGQFQLLRLVVSTSKSESGLLNDFADNLAHYSEENGEPFTRKRWIQEFLQGFLQGIIRSRVRQASWLDIRRFSVVKSLVKFRDEKHLAITQRALCICLLGHSYATLCPWFSTSPLLA